MRRSDQRRLAVFALYQHDLTGRELDDLFDRDTTEFTRQLAEQTLAGRGTIDQLLRAHIVEGWTLERIAPLERNILRVAVNEMVNRDDVPRAVAVDEAIELAKSYCSVDAPKFVNGILGAILRELPAPAPEAEKDD
ncbi:MAG: transcription antitermination factor NusB [Solirubrobacterales bacterium]